MFPHYTSPRTERYKTIACVTFFNILACSACTLCALGLRALTLMHASYALSAWKYLTQLPAFPFLFAFVKVLKYFFCNLQLVWPSVIFHDCYELFLSISCPRQKWNLLLCWRRRKLRKRKTFHMFRSYNLWVCLQKILKSIESLHRVAIRYVQDSDFNNGQ